jgi:hypothetical protein
MSERTRDYRNICADCGTAITNMDHPGLPHPKSLKASRKLKWVRA